MPSFVRVEGELPKLSSMKVNKTLLRAEAWRAERVYWRPSKSEALRDLTGEDRQQLHRLLS
jgi:fatty-acyl-CoA synthase